MSNPRNRKTSLMVQKKEAVEGFYRPLPPVTAHSRLALRVNAHFLPQLILVLKLHNSIYDRKQAVVRCAANVGAGMEAGAALHHEDAACGHELTRKAFDAEVLRIRV